jgi:topoisomerase-4 subunit A
MRSARSCTGRCHDARDGLKPVHRRILYAMRELRLASNGGFRKSAKISGDVMGNYHPHGDSAIYDAMARLAQDFVIRYPLVDGQGNFGNIDGDNPAASRYTEARMTAMAEALMEGLDEDAVDFRDNYDGTLREPEVLPAAVPNLLANGSSGIAVGMATNIPPHNLDELLRACEHLIKTPDARDDTLLNYVRGPDFPPAASSSNRPKAWRKPTAPGAAPSACAPNGRWRSFARHLADRRHRNPLPGAEIQADRKAGRTDPDQEGPDPRRCARRKRRRYPYRSGTARENGRRGCADGHAVPPVRPRNRFSLNMNVLIDGRTPKVCSLKEVLRAFLDHRRDVLLRRSQHRLEKIDHRLEVLEGFIIAFLNLDRVIDIIRYDDDPKPALMREDWSRASPAPPPRPIMSPRPPVKVNSARCRPTPSSTCACAACGGWRRWS